MDSLGSLMIPPLGKLDKRNAAIAVGVVALHASLIWALQSGSALHPPEVIVPVLALAELIAPPAPKIAPAPPAPPVPPVPVPKPVTPSVQKQAAPKTPAQAQPQPLAIADPTPSPNAPAGSLTPSPPATPAPPAPAAGPAAPPAPPAPAAVQLPPSNADYLHNPEPAYPPLSSRLGEKGQLTLRVLVSVNGQPLQARVVKSSGFQRLDQAALDTVMKRWQFVPGKRNGVAEESSVDVPVNFVLK